MKPLSDAARGLVDQLHARPSLLQRLSNATGMRCAVLAEIANAREPAAILYLIPFIFHESHDVASAASDAVRKLFLACADEELVGLDERIRDWSYWPRIGPWAQMQAHEVAKVSATEESHTTILGFMTCHRNGRVRQEAVVLLGKVGDRRAVPFLLLRANDWVPDVRIAAQNIIRQWLTEGPIDAFLSHLFLVFRLVECQRADSSDIVRTVAKCLLKPEYEGRLRDLIKQGNRMVTRRLFSIAVPGEVERPVSFVVAALDSDDVILRYRAAQAIPTIFRGEELVAILKRLRTDTFGTIRREGLRLWITHFPDSAVNVLEESLLDRSSSVRDEVVYQLRKIGNYDAASFFRNTLISGKHTTVAILGLGETGNKSDVAITGRISAPLSRQIASCGVGFDPCGKRR